MNKLVILTTSIIRGDNFHSRSIGQFYNKFFDYLEKKYEIFHIINIDEPENLKKYFNKYETINLFNSIIPSRVNKIYINESNPGFLQAYKKIINKIEQLDLVSENNLYYWLEDDWEPKSQYDITKFFDLLNFPNTAWTFTDRAPLGSFRGGPFMSGSYFINIFNIKKYMNMTCDPERQMQRWLRGNRQKNGNSYIHRLSIQNNNLQTDLVNIIIICQQNLINIGDLNTHHYKSGFDPNIKFIFHLLTWDDQFNFEYSICTDSTYNLVPISLENLKNLFDNNTIKYFIVKPSIMYDIGREFNKEFSLEKWTKIEDNTGYANYNYYNAYLGNLKSFDEQELRLKYSYTMNKGFFRAISYIVQCLPYLEKNYFNQNVKLNLLYYSHNYGNYPNFQVIGNLLELNYKPSVNIKNEKFDELICLSSLCKKICGNQTFNEEPSIFYSFKNCFKLAHNYFFKYFKFNQIIIKHFEEFILKFQNHKVLGLHFRGTDKNKVNLVTHITIGEFVQIIDYHLLHNNYDIIFISTDDNNFLKEINIKYNNKYKILHYDDSKNEVDNNSIHFSRLKNIEKIIDEIKSNKNNIEKIIELENKLKEETKINQTLLFNIIMNSLILSKCNCVLKTHSNLSAYSKIFNPELEIYRVNSCIEGYWPDSHIPLYNSNNISDPKIKDLLESKLLNEYPINKKYLYKDYY